MKVLEYVLLCTSMACFLYVIWASHRLRPLTARVIPAVLLGVIVLHWIFEHPRWIMLPVYGITIVVMVLCLFRGKGTRHTSRPFKRIRSILLSLFALLAAGLTWGITGLLPLFKFTEPSGPHRVGVIDYTWGDPKRTSDDGTIRRLNVRIWYPASKELTTSAHYIPQSDIFIQAVKKQYGLWSRLLLHYRKVEIPAQYAAPFFSKDTAVPVIVYLHGNELGTRFTGTFQALELASHGYMVIALEHPGTAFLSAYNKDDYIPFTHAFADLPNHFSRHNTVAVPIIQEMQDDVQFVLQYLQHIDRYETNSLLSNRMDPDRIAVVGHSFGGAVAAHMLANTTIVKVAVNFDGYLYGDYPDNPPQKPLLILNGGLLIKGLEETMTGLEEERAVRNRLLGQNGKEVTLPQAGHLTFTDLPLYSPRLFKPLAPDIIHQHRLINEYTLRFLNDHLVTKKEQR